MSENEVWFANRLTNSSSGASSETCSRSHAVSNLGTFKHNRIQPRGVREQAWKAPQNFAMVCKRNLAMDPQEQGTRMDSVWALFFRVRDIARAGKRRIAKFAFIFAFVTQI
jgi:hypothetical protein